MMKQNPGKCLIVVAAALLAAATASAQRPRPTPTPKAPRSIICAVLNDGKTLEPIAYINRGKLEAPVDGGDDSNIIAAFNRTYYRPGAAYRLVFGDANAGTVTVTSADHKAECSKNMAQATTRSNKTPLKGLVMALATNAPGRSTAAGFRRKPTVGEKDEIEALVRAEFTKQKLTPKVLRYHNFTALDLDND